MLHFSNIFKKFELENELSIVEGEGSLPFIKIDNEYATAVISIYGAQILSFKPKHTSNEALFLSKKAYYEEGKVIKGGIPICWPWFGQDPEKKGRPAHGFARNLMWQLVETSSSKSYGTQVILLLTDNDITRKLWPHTFSLSLTIHISETLSLSLKTTNTGTESFTVTQALHTYFAVSNIHQIRLVGLDQTQFIDTTQHGWPSLTQHGDILFKQEIDRIYTQAPELELIDEVRAQQLRIQPKGSKTTVVWNPWAELSKKSLDLTDEAYQQFLCVETANALDDFIEVLPNESFELSVKYSI